MIISVLIPSYRRPRDLQRCLSAIAAQTRTADKVVGVARVGDAETLAVLAEWQSKLPMEIVLVKMPGVVQAMNAGLARCEDDIVAITDDDAAPRPDWLARIQAHFAVDEKLGGVGGRDWVHQNGHTETGKRKRVGKCLWFGRIVGNHHLGFGRPRDVHLLKGANCAFRMSALQPVGFETRLRGLGAQVHWEMCLCFTMSQAGWRLLYDPEVAVDHYPAMRFDHDQRGTFNPVATADRSFNRRFAIRLIQPRWRRTNVLLWHILVGTRDEPGFVWLIRWALLGDKHALARYSAAVSGFWGRTGA